MTRRKAGRIGGAAAALAVLAFAAPNARARDAPCMIALEAIKGPRPHFTDYPARAEPHLKPAAPILATRGERAFRSMIREGAAEGPNFAGHFTIADWGCGAGCVDWAVIDARTGRVTLPKGLGDLDFNHATVEATAAGEGCDSLCFRPDSRLVILLGAPGEDQARDGASFYEWTGHAFRPVAFTPRDKACRPDP
jgi:hypothetical protein